MWRSLTYDLQDGWRWRGRFLARGKSPSSDDPGTPSFEAFDIVYRTITVGR
jgi:hypothetical protein